MLVHSSATRRPTGSIALFFALAAAACTGTIGSPATNSQGTVGTIEGTAGGGTSSLGGGGGGATVGSGASATVASGGSAGASAAPLPESPSPRLLRQLTLVEYTNTLTDLLQLTSPDTSEVPT